MDLKQLVTRQKMVECFFIASRNLIEWKPESQRTFLDQIMDLCLSEAEANRLEILSDTNREKLQQLSALQWFRLDVEIQKGPDNFQGHFNSQIIISMKVAIDGCLLIEPTLSVFTTLLITSNTQLLTKTKTELSAFWAAYSLLR